MLKFDIQIDKFTDHLHHNIETKISNEKTKKILHDIISLGNQKTISTAHAIHTEAKNITTQLGHHAKGLGIKVIEDVKKNPTMALMALLMMTATISNHNTTSTSQAKEHTHTIQDPKEDNTANNTPTLSLDQQKAKFGDYVALNKQLQLFDKTTTFGRRIRTMRYDKNIIKALEGYAPDISFESFLGLYMTEGEGNTASINHRDGGAGLLHIQPDVAQKDFDMKIFTDDPHYHQYDFATLKRQGKSKADIYKIHGKILKQIVEENDGQTRLATLDDRFNPQLCLNKVARRMQHDYDYAKKILNNNKTSSQEQGFKKYVNDTLHGDIYQYSAINAYNKGTGSFMKIATKSSGHHMENVHTNIQKIKKYNAVLEQGMKNGLQEEALWTYILEQIKPNTVQ